MTPTRPILPLMTERHAKRFWAKVDVRAPNECWPYRGARGYGTFQIGRSGVVAHRVAWTLHNNTELHGLLACHSCDNRWCVNPHHIWPGTHRQNNEDTVRKGRHHTQKTTRDRCLRINLSISRALHERLATWITGREMSVTKTAVVTVALKEFLTKQELPRV